MEFNNSEEEINYLRRCMSNLVSVLALPALWGRHEPRKIVATFQDALLATLNLDFIYICAQIETDGGPIEVSSTAPRHATNHNLDEVRRILHERFGVDLRKWPAEARIAPGSREASILTIRLGIDGEVGIVVAGSERADFPTQADRMLLGVATNQLTVALQQARLLNEQRRIADELEQRVADRTASLAAANEELKKEIAERKIVEEHLRNSESLLKTSEARLRQVIDTIPSLSWCNLPDGSNEFLSKGWHEYTGLSPEEAHGWGWQVCFHPEDLPPLMKRWKELLISGDPGEMEARLRRHDGVYRWFLIQVAPFRDEMGKIVRWYGTSTDINDRKLAVEALQTSERNLIRIINTIPTTAWSTLPDGYCDFLSQRWLSYAGFSAEEAKGWGWGEVIHPDDVNGLIEYWQSCLASGTPVDAEARMRRFDGTYRWFLFRANPLRDDSGHIVKWYGTNIDIDDRKRAEEELRRSEARKAAILNSALDCIVTIDHEGRITEFNPAAERTFGYRRIDVIGRYLSEVIIPPSNREKHRQGLARYQATGETQVLGRRVELTATRADGTEFPVEVAISRIPMDGPPAFTGYLRDITQRKRAEEELRRSEAFLSEGQRLGRTGSFFWRVATEEIVWSEQVYRIFELDPGLTMTLELIGTRVHPEDLPMLFDMFERAQSGSDFEYEHRLLLPGNRVKYLHLVGHGNRNSVGQWEYVGAVQDVTESRLSVEALDRARSELANLARSTSLGVLTASIAHEVNQPLSGIVTNASTCLRMLNSEPPNIDGARETARRTIRDGNRASEVITRLRALFKKKEFAVELIDLNEATREVIALSLSELQSNRIIVRHQLTANLPAVKGDRIQLQQVILNLLRNASDAMRNVDDRPRQLLIKTECDDSKDVQLIVQDSGIGFDARAADRLFESFYTTKDDGMGIGLSVSRSIIEAHRGRLWAMANDGPGSTFAFSIPLDHGTEHN